ncbi:MAG TPA: hypothetical protein VMV72_13930 [Verrucomicrobiae bacterium]|nr:hypothetical protein [Verrucomicrobiae bacterium]
MLGRPTDSTIAVNALAETNLVTYFEYGTQSTVYVDQTVVTNLIANQPTEVNLSTLQPDTRYYYRLEYKLAGDTSYQTTPEYTFHTQRAPGSSFTFCIQGDSHPERVNTMFDAGHYSNTLLTAAVDQPDFYMTIGDDFSVDRIPTNQLSASTVIDRYILQRPYLGLIGNSAPLFLVNGNHEQAAAYLLDGTSNNVAVWAQTARNSYYSEPAPNGFYTGNTNVVQFIGLLRNYYAWTWGDALFVTIDPYWSSPVCVDNVLGDDQGTGAKRTNVWDVTHGDPQFQWLKTTLEQSTAKYKFVFAHHVLGTGRGGIEEAQDYEWGGYSVAGSTENFGTKVTTYDFPTYRPLWAMPIHQLMVSNHVTIFFQGHDHIFVRGQLDGVTYVTLPNPADPNYSLFNSDAYTSYIYKTNNSGYVRVNVSLAQVKVDYVRTYLPSEEGPGRTNGMVDYSFTLSTSNSQPPAITNVTTSPGVPVEGSPTWITALVTDAVGVASVTLRYSTGGPGVTNTVFLETMATNSVKPWTGTGCDEAWTVTYTGSNPFQQISNANYGGGNTNGLAFKGGTTNLADSMITTAGGINASGNSGTVSFAVLANGLTTNTGWAMQLNSGTGFTTRVSELTGSNHTWQVYNYSLLPGDLLTPA